MREWTLLAVQCYEVSWNKTTQVWCSAGRYQTWSVSGTLTADRLWFTSHSVPIEALSHRLWFSSRLRKKNLCNYLPTKCNTPGRSHTCTTYCKYTHSNTHTVCVFLFQSGVLSRTINMPNMLRGVLERIKWDNMIMWHKLVGSTCNLHENLFHHKQRQTALLFGPWLPGNGHLSADGSAAVRPSTSSVQLHNNHCSRIMKDSVFWSSLRPTFPPHSSQTFVDQKQSAALGGIWGIWDRPRPIRAAPYMCSRMHECACVNTTCVCFISFV